MAENADGQARGPSRYRARAKRGEVSTSITGDAAPQEELDELQQAAERQGYRLQRKSAGSGERFSNSALTSAGKYRSTIYLTPEVREALHYAEWQRKATMSGIVEEALRLWLKQEGFAVQSELRVD